MVSMITAIQWKSNIHIYLYLQIVDRVTSPKRLKQHSRQESKDVKSEEIEEKWDMHKIKQHAHFQTISDV